MRARLASCVVALAVLAGCSATDDPPEGAEPPVPDARPDEGSHPDELPAELVTATQVAEVDGAATTLASSPGGEELLVGVQDGRVFRVRREGVDGEVVPSLDDAPVLDLSDTTVVGALEGLFGLAVSPDGAWLYVDRIDATDGLVVERYAYEPGADVDRATVARVATLQVGEGNGHYGGGLAFDGDGRLYVAVGDQAYESAVFEGRFVPGSIIQDPTSGVGSVVAIDLDPATGEADGEPRTVAYGLRNPWRISIDRDLGDLWIGDVGYRHEEEIDLVEADDLADPPENFGWPLREGTAPGLLPGRPEGGVAPLLAYPHGEGACGVVGGAVYRGRRLPELYGAYLYGDLCSSAIRAMLPGEEESVEIARTTATTTSIDQGADGEIYVLGQPGLVFRLDPGRPDPAPEPLDLAVGSGVGDDQGVDVACDDFDLLNGMGATLGQPGVTLGEARQQVATVVRAFRRSLPRLDDDGRAAVTSLVDFFERVETSVLAGDASAPAAAALQQLLRPPLSDEVSRYGQALADACD
jgi:glucose/arabinose dehydrogenase